MYNNGYNIYIIYIVMDIIYIYTLYMIIMDIIYTLYRVIFLHFPTEKLKYLGIYSTDFNQFGLVLISG